MFIDGILTDDRSFQLDAEGVSKFLLAGIVHYQRSRPPDVQDGKVTTHVIFAAAAFSLGVVVKDLPPRERRKLREYLVHKLDEMLKEHGAPS